MHHRFPQKRQQQMIDVIIERKRVSNADLSAILDISLPTVRRDLAVLEQAGVVTRTHGGVVARGVGEDATEPLFLEKVRQNQNLKQRIGQAAAAKVLDGQVVLLDSGTTALATAHALAGRRVTIVAIDLKVAEAASVGATEVHIVGGRVRNGYFSLVGNWAKEALSSIRADICFLAADAVDHDGITTATFEEAETKQKAIQRAKRIVVITDHGKFGKRAFAQVCGLDAIDELITDRGGADLVASYRPLIPAITLV
ncbi:DeoR/GlpR family DNA-binding transcription regulator [Nitratireductor aquibiodomus]|uniref:DeoR/GlpR family DNA-binding transcription regulator n=1 Tax=Nitratireductor aquibiodomus TaxID=204799 RepID=UPI000468AD38|nr:DeoR/GlpR family DNA-binding transcription regulator [Nitratireductor aquibiodomus]